MKPTTTHTTTGSANFHHSFHQNDAVNGQLLSNCGVSSRKVAVNQHMSRQQQAAQVQHAHVQQQQHNQFGVLPFNQAVSLFAANPYNYTSAQLPLSNTIPYSAVQQYTHPYNATNLQIMSLGSPYHNLQQMSLGCYPYYLRHPQQQPPVQAPQSYGASAKQHNFFDFQVQSNVDPYYAEQCQPRDQEQQRQHKPYNYPMCSGVRDINIHRSIRYSGNNTDFQRPSYDRNRHAVRSLSARYNRRGNSKSANSPLRMNPAVAEPDALCWIYENQGRCQYGEKCRWLHLDRKTGQFVPTVYLMNSLKSTQYRSKEKQPSLRNRDRNEDSNDGDNKNHADQTEEPAAGEGGRGKAGKTEKALSEELSKKFQILMTESIQQKIDVDQNDTDTDEDDDDDDDEEEKTEDEQEEDGKEKDKEYKEKQKNGPKCGAYGTTFDKQNVCWEFNTFAGCRKGTKCKWAHQYLIAPNAVHPYTGEKLNGLAVRKFRITNNM